MTFCQHILCLIKIIIHYAKLSTSSNSDIDDDDILVQTECIPALGIFNYKMASGSEEITSSVSQNSDAQDCMVHMKGTTVSQQERAVMTTNPEEMEVVRSQDDGERLVLF